MSSSKFSVTSALLALVLSGFGLNDAKADHLRRLDDLARDLEGKAERLDREVDAHFRGLPFVAGLRHDVCEMSELADHIHDLIHRNASLGHIEHDLEELDARFHEVEDTVFELQRIQNRRSSYHGGHRLNDSHVRRLADRVRDMGRTLHCMQDEVTELQHEAAQRSRVPVQPTYFERRPTHGYYFEGNHIHVPIGSRDGKQFSFSLRLN